MNEEKEITVNVLGANMVFPSVKAALLYLAEFVKKLSEVA